MIERQSCAEDMNYPSDDKYELVGEPVIRDDGIILTAHESANGYFRVELQNRIEQWSFTPADLMLIGNGDSNRAKLEIVRALYGHDLENGTGGDHVFVNIID